MIPRWLVAPAAVVAGAASLYALGLATGFVTAVGYTRETARLVGPVKTGFGNVRFGLPVHLEAGDAIGGDFDVDAKVGAVMLMVRPHIFARRSPLQAANLYVEGRRAGRALFVAEAAGWYTFAAAATPNGGASCIPPGTTPALFSGDPRCPTYDVSYTVAWRWLGKETTGPTEARLAIPSRPNALATARLGQP